MKNQKGITLIALIITIIVMLILVGVSVTVAINTGLFTTASGVSKNTEVSRDEELERANGLASIKGVGTKDVQDYVDTLTGKNGEDAKKKMEGYTHKMTITIKKDADEKLDANGTVTVGTYEYYIKEGETTGENLVREYSQDFSEVDGKIMFLNEFDLISCYSIWEHRGEQQLPLLAGPYFCRLEKSTVVYGDEPANEWETINSSDLSIVVPEDAYIYLNSQNKNTTPGEDGKGIDFTFTKL